MPNKPSTPDLSLIKPEKIPASTEGERLFAGELESYAEYDEEDEKRFNRRVRTAFLAREIAQIDTIVSERKIYANKIFCLVVYWLVGIAFFLVLQGFHVMGFNLADKTMLALIGGTTLNVVGIFAVVANFLFPKNGSPILTKDLSTSRGSRRAEPPSSRLRTKVGR